MDRNDLFWQSKVYGLERRIEKLEAKLRALEDNPMNASDFYTVRQVAKMLNTCDLTIRRKLMNGQVEGYKVGRQWRIPKSVFDKHFDLSD